MGRKITVTLELDADVGNWLDEWQPYPRPFLFPAPTRDEKVMLAVYAAIIRHEAMTMFNEECDAISRMWGWTPPCVTEAKKRARRRRQRKKRSGLG